MLKKVSLALSLAFITFNATAQSSIPEELAKRADAGVSAIYNLDLDSAKQQIDQLLIEYPNYPIGLFGRTMIEWSRFEYEFEKSNPAQAVSFKESIDTSIEGINQWLKDNQPDAQAYLALGGVYGVKGRFELANKSFVKAYFSGRKGLKFMNKAAKLDPNMYDAYLGEAVYQYYAGTLPSVVKILAKLVVSGNADKGIEYLNLIMNKGRFSADTAKLLLVEVSIESEKYYNPPLAAQYIEEIRQKYPQNPLYNFVGIIAAYENKQYDKVITDAQDFLSKIGKVKFYSDIYISRAYTAIGTAYMAKGDYNNAKQAFESSIKATATQDMSRWQLWNELRLAQVYDALGQKQQAADLYKTIEKRKETWGIDEVAHKYLKEGFRPGTYPGHMSPP